MEYLDVLDANGKPTGQKKSRADVHRDGDWHRSVHVWVMNAKQELLMQKRSATTDTSPNLWDISSAGHISSGGDPLSSAMKEMQEELGLTLVAENFENIGEVTQQKRESTYWNREFNNVYLVRRDVDLAKLRLQKEEVTEVRWVHFKELEKLIDARDPQFVPHEQEYKKLFALLHKRYDSVEV